MEDAVLVQGRLAARRDRQGVGGRLDDGRAAYGLTRAQLGLLVDLRLLPAVGPPDVARGLRRRALGRRVLARQRGLLGLHGAGDDRGGHEVAELGGLGRAGVDLAVEVLERADEPVDVLWALEALGG